MWVDDTRQKKDYSGPPVIGFLVGLAGIVLLIAAFYVKSPEVGISGILLMPYGFALCMQFDHPLSWSTFARGLIGPVVFTGLIILLILGVQFVNYAGEKWNDSAKRQEAELEQQYAEGKLRRPVVGNGNAVLAPQLPNFHVRQRTSSFMDAIGRAVPGS